MSHALNYALRLNQVARVTWTDIAQDVRDGAFATARFVVTFAGCITLVALAVALGNDAARHRVLTAVTEAFPAAWAAKTVVAEVPSEVKESPLVIEATFDPKQRLVTQYLARRYRVADEAVSMLVAAAFDIGREQKVDPLLILSVVAVESSLNPFAESAVGAQGLMQVMTRVHAVRFEAHGGQLAALDPIANMKVGTAILQELIARGGSVERGLQLYVGAGNAEDDGGYSGRVLGERSRLQMAVAGKLEAAISAGRSVPIQAETKPAPVPAPMTVHLPATDAETDSAPAFDAATKVPPHSA